MRHRTARGSWRAAAATLVAGTLLAGLAGVTAYAEDDTSVSPTPSAVPLPETASPVKVVLTGLSPVTVTRSNTLVISGHVSNTGLTDLVGLSVQASLSTQGLTQRRDVRRVARDVADNDISATLIAEDSLARTLRPGAQRNFKMTVSGADLPLDAAGVYVLRLDVLGTNDAGSGVLGTARTFLPWMPYPTNPVRVALLWPLATLPGVLANGTLQGDLLPREISTDGRLRRLLDIAAANSDQVSWILDPELPQTVSSMTDGYLVEKRGTLRPGTAQKDASEWLQTLRSAVGPRPRQKSDKPLPQVWTLPYADTDADAAVRAGLDTDVVRAVTSGPDVVRQTVQANPAGTLFWATRGRLAQSTLDVLGSANVDAVVLRANSARPQADLDYTPSGYTDLDTRFGPVRALLIDDALMATLAMPQTNRSQILLARQRFLAELAVVNLRNPTAFTYLVAGPGNPRWSPSTRLLRSLLASLRQVPYARTVPIQEVLAQPTSGIRRNRADYTSKDRSHELSEAYMGRVAQAQADVESLRSVMVDPASVTEPMVATLLRAESSAWRVRPPAGLALVDSVNAQVKEQTSQVYVVQRQTVTFSGDRGSVPITLANDFDQSVRVGVQLTGIPQARLDADPIADVTIEPGHKASLEVPVRVIGSDPLTVSVQVTDVRGRPFGAASTMELRTTAYSRAALWVAVAAAVLLVLLVIFDIVRRARARRARPSEARPTDTQPVESRT